MSLLKRKMALLLILCSITIVVGFCLKMNIVKKTTSAAQILPPLYYRNYSTAGDNYSILGGLLIKAKTVKFQSKQKAKVLGTELQFSKFDVLAPITVQTSSAYTSGAYTIAIGRYSLSIALDSNDTARQEFIRQVKSYWLSKTDEDLRDYKVMPAEKYIWMSSQRYVLYAQPDNESEGATYLFYTSGKIIKLTFEGFKSGDGWGSLSSFVYDNLLFHFPDVQIRGGYTPDVEPKQFLKLYKDGFFDKRPKK